MSDIKLKRSKDVDSAYTYETNNGVWKVFKKNDGQWAIMNPEHCVVTEGATLKDARQQLTAEIEQYDREVAARRNAASIDKIPAKLQKHIDAGTKAREDFTENLTGPGSLCRQVEWGRNIAEDYRASHAITLLAIIEEKEKPLKEILQNYRDRLMERLMSNKYRHNSTSALHNAINEIKREVVIRFVRDLDIWLYYFKQQKEL